MLGAHVATAHMLLQLSLSMDRGWPEVFHRLVVGGPGLGDSIPSTELIAAGSA